MSLAGILLPALLVSIGVGFAAALVAWRDRREPGAMPLVMMLAGQVTWSVCLFYQLRAPTLASKVFWEQLTWVGIVVIPIAWLLFVLEFTGRDRYATAKYVGALAVVPAVTVVLALTSQSHDLLYAESRLVEFQGRQFLHRERGPWLWVITGYTYLLGALGSIPLLGLVQRQTTTFRGQSGALLVGTVTPWASNVLFLSGLVPIPALDPTPVAFLVSGVAYLAAVKQFSLFGTTPAAGQHARRLLIDQLDDGALVVDTHDHVVELNDHAAAIFGTETDAALGKPVADVVPGCDALRHGGDLTDHPVRSDHTDEVYDVTQTEITNSHGYTVGTMFVFRNVSEYVRTQQRYRVLNRLFRHNVRTKTNVVLSHAELLEQGYPDGDPTAIKDTALDIESLAAKSREILDLFEYERAPATATPLSAVLTAAIDRVQATHPSVAVETEHVPDDVYVDEVLETVFANVLANAVEHAADPTPEIRVSPADDTVTIAFADAGPGLDGYERDVIQRGTEDPLRHGSGLGLWLIKWGAEIAGGEVTFTDGDVRGTVVEITVPRRDDSDAEAAVRAEKP